MVLESGWEVPGLLGNLHLTPTGTLPLPGSGLFPSSQGLGALVGRERVSQSTDTCLSPLAPPGEEYRPLLLYPETTAQILVQALNPLDYRKWRTKPMYWRVLKVFKVRGAPGARLLTW